MLDNGAFHKARALSIPHNIALAFLPPYSPELNPDEKIWALWKRKFTNKLFKRLEDISLFITQQVTKLAKYPLFTITKFDYIFLLTFQLLYKRKWYKAGIDKTIHDSLVRQVRIDQGRDSSLSLGPYCICVVGMTGVMMGKQNADGHDGYNAC